MPGYGAKLGLSLGYKKGNFELKSTRELPCIKTQEVKVKQDPQNLLVARKPMCKALQEEAQWFKPSSQSQECTLREENNREDGMGKDNTCDPQHWKFLVI